MMDIFSSVGRVLNRSLNSSMFSPTSCTTSSFICAVVLFGVPFLRPPVFGVPLGRGIFLLFFCNNKKMRCIYKIDRKILQSWSRK